MKNKNVKEKGKKKRKRKEKGRSYIRCGLRLISANYSPH
jgi:hypothetical protein